jgi:trichohyalin
LSKYAYLKDEKKKLEKKGVTKDDHFMRYLKVQLDRAKKLKKVKAKLEEKDKRIENFMKAKKKGRKIMENERYQDHQGVYERQKIYEKMLENYDQKVFLSKKQQQEKNNFNTLSNDKIGLEKSKSKMEELKGQIKEYERKNIEYQQKINDLFALKDKNEMNKKIKERIENKDNKKDDLSTSFSMKKKLDDMEEKLEIEKLRRENALMENMKNFQDKINQYLEKNEKKEEKIKNAIKKAEKEREDRRMVRSNHFNEVRENIKKNEIKKESERQKLLETIEKKNLKDFAVRQEKKIMDEKRKKMNNFGRYEREQLKKKVQEIIDGETNYEDGLKSEEILNRLLQSQKKQNQNNDEDEENNEE